MNLKKFHAECNEMLWHRTSSQIDRCAAKVLHDEPTAKTPATLGLENCERTLDLLLRLCLGTARPSVCSNDDQKA